MEISDQLIEFFSNFQGVTAYLAIFGVLLACGFGLPLPEDIILISAGILASQGNMDLYGAILIGYIGVMVGDGTLFFLGRGLGYRVFKLPIFRSIFTEERIHMARSKIIDNSKFVCFTARFLPGLRAPIYLTAGIMGVRPIIFFTLDSLAAVLSVPVWVLVGYWFGSHLEKVLEIAKEIQLWVFGGLALFIISYILLKRRRKKLKKKLSK